MKKFLVLLFAILTSVSASAQTSGINAKRIFSGTAVPTMNCSPGPSYRDVYIRTTTNVVYQCTAAPATWTAVTTGGSPGTVTSVTGTANQIDVATGTTTPVLSLPSAVTMPGTLTMTGQIFSGDGTNTAPTFANSVRTNSGLRISTYYPVLTVNGTDIMGISNSAGAILKSDQPFGWSDVGGALAGGAADTRISRNAAGIVQVGTTANNASGSLLATNATFSGTLTNSGIASDAATTNNTVCTTTTTNVFTKGSGTAGICLGTSGAKFKQNMLPLNMGLNQVMDLRPISYNYKSGYGYDPNKTYYGFTAESVAPVIPNLAPKDVNGAPQSVDLVGMIPVLVHAIQEQQAQITVLKQQVETLKHKRKH